LGGAIGFLFFNFPPASVFMGDSGSLVLGFVLALLPLLPVSPQAAHISAIQPLTILFIPILDTGAAIIRRLMRGEPVHAPDREHLHHKLLDLGLSSRQVLAVIYGVAALLGGIAVSYRFLPKEAATIIFLCVCATGVASMRLLAVRHSRKVTPRHVTFTKPRGVAATTDPAEVEEARHDMDRAAR
jgi:UDP-GlcNAc:undecaprenyl-phosphate GlcNAc-1-phosphate transferase